MTGKSVVAPSDETCTVLELFTNEGENLGLN
jgi:hypothetical protein